jgi:hypothetical protein
MHCVAANGRFGICSKRWKPYYTVSPPLGGLFCKRNIKQRLDERGGVVGHAPWGSQLDFPSGEIQALLRYETTGYGRYFALAVDNGRS